MNARPVIGFDVEMGVFLEDELIEIQSPKIKKSQLAIRVAIVDSNKQVLYNKLVNPTIFGMSTYQIHETAGTNEFDVDIAAMLSDELPKIRELLRGKIIVGHSIDGDLRSLLLSSEAESARDISQFECLLKMAFEKTKRECRSLKDMYEALTGDRIQTGISHDPVEDAWAALRLYLLYKDIIEKEVNEKQESRKLGDVQGAVTINSPYKIDYSSQLNQRRNHELGGQKKKSKINHQIIAFSLSCPRQNPKVSCTNYNWEIYNWAIFDWAINNHVVYYDSLKTLMKSKAFSYSLI